jgi:hypothetical protein
MNLISKIQTPLICASIFLLAVAGSSAWAQKNSGFETPPIRSASDILPAYLIQGESFKVNDKVRWKEGLHEFTVESEYGSFEVWGEPMLRVRLREVEAMNTLRKISSTSVGTAAAAKQVGSSIKSLGTAFRHPVKTAQGVPEGVKRLFKSTKYDIDEVAKTGKAAKQSAGGNASAGQQAAAVQKAGAKVGRSLAGVNSAYRKWAEYVGVNPYTTNTALYAELDRLAKVEAGAKIGTKIFVPSIIPEELKLVRDISKTAYHKDWREIIEHNKASLVTLGVSEDVKARYQENPHINLTLSTLVIELLLRMEGVEHRDIVIQQASLLKTDAEAVFFVECLMMAEWFHEHMNPATRMLGGTLIPVILTQDGRVVAFSASDFEYWTKKVATISSDFNNQYVNVSRKREIWVADQVSSGFVSGVSHLGWSVRSDLRARVLPEVPWGLQDEG